MKISNKGQLLFCIRRVDNDFAVQKEFLESYKLSNMKSETFLKIINDIFLRFQLPLQLCLRQCFDISINMLEKRSAVTIQIYQRAPESALYPL